MRTERSHSGSHDPVPLQNDPERRQGYLGRCLARLPNRAQLGDLGGRALRLAKQVFAITMCALSVFMHGLSWVVAVDTIKKFKQRDHLHSLHAFFLATTGLAISVGLFMRCWPVATGQEENLNIEQWDVRIGPAHIADLLYVLRN